MSRMRSSNEYNLIELTHTVNEFAGVIDNITSDISSTENLMFKIVYD